MRNGRTAALWCSLLLALVSVVGSACSAGGGTSGGKATPAGDAAGPGPVGTLRFAGAAPLVTFDPHRAQAGVQSAGFLTLVYDGLVTSEVMRF